MSIARGLAIACLLIVCVPATALAQAFVEPIRGLARAAGSYVMLKDGTRLEGKVTAYVMTPYVKSLTLKTDSGETHKLKSEDIEHLGNKLSGFLKWSLAVGSIDDSVSTPWGMVRELRGVDWQSFMTRDYVLFDQALTPKGNTRLLQKLNPGFDSRLRVYQHLKLLTFGASDEVVTYLVVKDGSRPFLVKKKTYAKQFAQLYGDCQEFMDTFQGGKPKFRDLPGHIAVYDRLCGGEGHGPR